jgi:hypothetical protein
VRGRHNIEMSMCLLGTVGGWCQDLVFWPFSFPPAAVPFGEFSAQSLARESRHVSSANRQVASSQTRNPFLNFQMSKLILMISPNRVCK